MLGTAACSAPPDKPPRAEAEAAPVTPPAEPDVAPSSPSAPPPPEGPAPAPLPDTAPPCAEADLALGVAGFDVALGSRYLLLGATNASDEACALGGRPDLVFVRASGTVTPDVTLVPRATNPAPAGPVVVPPGGAAYAELRWSAMSTTQDPDVSVAVRVRAVPGARGVEVPIDPPEPEDMTQEPPTWVDVLAGAEVEVGSWAAAVEGWTP